MLAVAGKVSDKSSCATTTTAAGLGLKQALPGQEASFLITACDRQGAPRGTGGDTFVVELKDRKGQKVDVKLEDKGDGTYHATYLLPEEPRSKLQLSVFLRGEHIQGSPYTITAVPPVPGPEPVRCSHSGKIVQHIILQNGVYRITSCGAKAADSNNKEGGTGAIISAEFDLKKGDRLHILCGGMSRRYRSKGEGGAGGQGGNNAVGFGGGGGGGGGFFGDGQPYQGSAAKAFVNGGKGAERCGGGGGGYSGGGGGCGLGECGAGGGGSFVHTSGKNMHKKVGHSAHGTFLLEWLHP
eukprot:g13142.t1